MKETGTKMSCTEGLFGFGIYDSSKEYKKYNSEYYYGTLQNIFKSKGSRLLDNGFPKIWDLYFVKIYNCVICSSVVLEKSILDKINNMKLLKNGEEDYDCWLRSLEFTKCVYVDDILFYYDSGHGNGQNY